ARALVLVLVPARAGVQELAPVRAQAREVAAPARAGVRSRPGRPLDRPGWLRAMLPTFRPAWVATAAGSPASRGRWRAQAKGASPASTAKPVPVFQVRDDAVVAERWAESYSWI